MFQLTSTEAAELNRSQIVIGSAKHRNESCGFETQSLTLLKGTSHDEYIDRLTGRVH